MAADDHPRPIVEKFTSLLSRHPENVSDHIVRLWESVCSEISPIIGEDGFAILFARCVQLSQSDFPWLAQGHISQPGNVQFIPLKASLEKRAFHDASAASHALLVIFTDILAVLIGENLTNTLLIAIWGDYPTGVTSKEHQL